MMAQKLQNNYIKKTISWFLENQKPNFQFALSEGLSDEFLPTKAEPHATGWDVRAAEGTVIAPGDYFKIPLGFRAFPPEGWWFNLHPRSSSFTKKHMHNLIGIIDEHYSEGVLFAGQYIASRGVADNLVIKFGDAIGQIVPVKRVEMKVKRISNQEYDSLCKKRTAIRDGGFGSTDIK
jgi:dUTP pyrophosphatase